MGVRPDNETLAMLLGVWIEDEVAAPTLPEGRAQFLKIVRAALLDSDTKRENVRLRERIAAAYAALDGNSEDDE